MTPAQVLAYVRRQVHESSPNFWSDAEIYGYMWDAEQIIVREYQCYETTDTSTSTVASTQAYAWPTGCLYITRLTYDGVKLQKISQSDQDALDGTSYGSTLSSAKPEFYWEYGDYVYLYPVPNAAATLKFFYAKEPTEITSSSTAFSVPALFHRSIPFYCLHLMYAKRGEDDEGKATYFNNLWLRSLADNGRYWERRRHGDMYSVVRTEDNYNTTSLGLI